MKKHHNKIEQDEWVLKVDCPFNGNKTNYADSGIVLNGNGTFVNDPAGEAIQVASFMNDGVGYYISLTDWPIGQAQECKIELDFRFVSYRSYNNIVDSGKSGNGGVFVQIESGNLRHGLTSCAYNYTAIEFSKQVKNTPMTLIGYNQWAHLYMERHANHIRYEIRDSNGNLLSEFESDYTPALIYTSHERPFYIGRSSSFVGRYMNGYIKNLKIWYHV